MTTATASAAQSWAELRTRFREIWSVDFEYRHPDGEHVVPICMVATELVGGRHIRMWRDELLALDRAPFDVGAESLFVAYAANAELGCFAELGWPFPVNVLDLFAEFRVITNRDFKIRPLKAGDGLLGALMYFGCSGIDADHKDAMRNLILSKTDYTHLERQQILEYCDSDVVAAAELLPRMLPLIKMEFALVRGHYGAAVARMERTGIPVDVNLHRRLTAVWPALLRDLTDQFAAQYGIYEDGHFRTKLFKQALRRWGLWGEWPLNESGTSFSVESDALRYMATKHPELPQLRLFYELRSTLGKMRLTGLTIGSDDRNRCSLMPFRSITGRNQPSNTKYIFGPAVWMRGLIMPPDGWAIAYLDFASQEIILAGALSGDEHLLADYASGDVYMALAIACGAAPEGATKRSHHKVRELFKSTFLAVNYGMGKRSLAARINNSAAEAQMLLERLYRRYSRYRSWSLYNVDKALMGATMETPFGWQRHHCELTRKTTELLNWPMQSLGGDLMRITTIAATEAGIQVCAPVHDGFLIAAPLDRIEDAAALMREIMMRAGQIATGGPTIRVDVSIVRSPARYMDKRGVEMWLKAMKLLAQHEGDARAEAMWSQAVAFLDQYEGDARTAAVPQVVRTLADQGHPLVIL